MKSAPVDVFLATGNAHKVAEFSALAAAFGLPWRLRPATELGGMPPVEESGTTFAANAAIKAAALALLAPGNAWVLADDSGLEVVALDGHPGVRSACFAGPGATDADNRRALLAALAATGAPPPWPAAFRCALDLRRGWLGCSPADAPGVGLVSRGTCPGRIVSAERGDGGFGYDPLFIPVGETRTFAELPAARKDSLSHRGRAFAALAAAWR